jgi:hypothetical protein
LLGGAVWGRVLLLMQGTLRLLSFKNKNKNENLTYRITYAERSMMLLARIGNKVNHLLRKRWCYKNHEHFGECSEKNLRPQYFPYGKFMEYL